MLQTEDVCRHPGQKMLQTFRAEDVANRGCLQTPRAENVADIRTEDVHQGKYSVMEDRQVKDLLNSVGEPQTVNSRTGKIRKEYFKTGLVLQKKVMMKLFRINNADKIADLGMEWEC